MPILRQGYLRHSNGASDCAMPSYRHLTINLGIVASFWPCGVRTGRLLPIGGHSGLCGNSSSELNEESVCPRMGFLHVLIDPCWRIGFVAPIHLYVKLLCPAVPPHGAKLGNIGLSRGVSGVLQSLR